LRHDSSDQVINKVHVNDIVAFLNPEWQNQRNNLGEGHEGPEQ